MKIDKYFHMYGTKDDIRFEEVPSPTIESRPKWIPCSERLPEDDEMMLVQYVPRPGEGDIWIGWHEMENVWYIDGNQHSKDLGNEVVAWMPLPEPYRKPDSVLDIPGFEGTLDQLEDLHV